MTFTNEEEITIKLIVAELKAKIKYNSARIAAIDTTDTLKTELVTVQTALTDSVK